MRVVVEPSFPGELEAPGAADKLQKAFRAAAEQIGSVPEHGGEWAYTEDLTQIMRRAYDARMVRLAADLEGLLRG